MAHTTEVQQFRHRGYQDETDATKRIEVYGNDPEPMGNDGLPLKKLWDKDISSIKISSDHVEPAALPAS